MAGYRLVAIPLRSTTSTGAARIRILRPGGGGRTSPLDDVQHQVLLGNPTFVAEFRDAKPPDELCEVSKAHRRSVAKPLEYYQSTYTDRNMALAKAYVTGAYTMKEIGDFFGVHYMTVSRALRAFEADPRSESPRRP
ncbi:MAG: hypothetical protein ACFCVA_14015 [Gammaproteobacteria bacterium]